MRYVFLILGVLVLVVGAGIIQNKDRSLRLREIPRRLEINRAQLRTIADALRAYRTEKGEFPSNDQGLQALGSLKSFESIDETARSKDFYAGLQIKDGILYSIWGEPFIYENRRELAESLFAGSPANKDTGRVYSIEVEKGVYVWSLGAAVENEARGIRPSRWEIVIGLVSVVLIGLYIGLTVRSVGRRFHGFARVARTAWSLLGGASIAAGIVLLLFPAFVRTCYVAVIHRRPSDKLRNDYTTLMTKYHERGIIGDSAFKKIEAAMKKSSDED